MVVVNKSPGSFANFNLNDSIVARLEEKGVKELFPVQYKTFKEIRNGRDAVVLARTGTGKTLAFALPLLHSLLDANTNLRRKKPLMLVLAPTRELVVQIAADFESIKVNNIRVLAVYGGVPYGPQCSTLRSGVDIVIGAPGRITDLMEKGVLDVSEVKHVVLDEVDRMLDMGFSKHVENILSSLYGDSGQQSSKKPQTLLFSATMPSWVSSIAQKYLSDDTFRISLIDKQETQTSKNITHLALLCPYHERASTLADIIKVYSKRNESRCIVFCERKKDADELASHNAMANDCHVFHGDIPQDKRELVLQKFREGKYHTLVTTNVAARGLDIPDVDLVIQCHPPKDVQDYIHRSGRTGRAERSGTAICFFTSKEREALSRIERVAGISFRRISAPTVQDIANAWGQELADTFASIPEATWSAFIPLAQSLTKSLQTKCNGVDLSDQSPAKIKKSKSRRDSESDEHSEQSQPLLRVLCCALARLSGKDSKLETRSKLSSLTGFTAYRLDLDRPANHKGLAYVILKRQLPEDIVNSAKNMGFIQGRTGFVFDLPSENDEIVQQTWVDDGQNSLTLLTELPELEPEASDFNSRSSYNSGNGGGYNRGYGGRGRSNWNRQSSQNSYSTNRFGKHSTFNESNGYGPVKRTKLSFD